MLKSVAYVTSDSSPYESLAMIATCIYAVCMLLYVVGID